MSEDNSFGGRFRRYARVGSAVSGVAAKAHGRPPVGAANGYGHGARRGSHWNVHQHHKAAGKQNQYQRQRAHNGGGGYNRNYGIPTRPW